MNIRQIETFLAVAESGSFRRAAELLHRSQSVVSVHVQQLEEDLGVPLLERTTRRVSLTPEGRTFLLRCKGVMADLKEVAQQLREESILRRGRVSIGAAPSVSTHRLPPIIAAYQRLYPGVTLELHEAFAKGMYNDVLERVTDFAIGPRVSGLKDFDIQPIIRDPIVAVLPNSIALNTGSTVTLKRIAREPQLSMPRGTAIRETVERAFQDAGFDFSPRFEVMHQQTLFSLIEAGLGVTLLPFMSVPPDRKGQYHVAVLKDPAITREICLITLKGKKLSPAASTCAEMIASELQSQFKQSSQLQRRGSKT
ncbi:LysR family transcriptional regulator [Hydrogenophaga sp. BPS33]|uniref:LysR family transcriptional regulator n=1 Tax=Hydrogenophaga sp. BPS33 TaxID=2651974 RepID=UPI001320082B|nr:LysR family transcriptional regulator [Hydrogenophaga sp. BPS33]QHE83406.1 LysR family transcriptional regulator [Hydrogenophaga sp. BPS33]